MSATIVFLDVPNILKSLRQYRKTEINVPELVEKSGGWKNVVEVRAYADVTMLSDRLRRHFDREAVTLVHVRCRKGDGTQDSDIDFALAADLLEAAITRKDLEGVVLAGGDGDFFWAMSKAKRFGKKIGVVAVRESLSRELAALAGDTVAYLEGTTPEAA